MVQFNTTRLDASFAALADATRRSVLEHLGRAELSITALAALSGMTLTGMKKHIAVLERGGLVITRKIGRVRSCRLNQRALQQEAAWIEQHRHLWSQRFDALDAVVEDLKQKEKGRGAKRRK
jgi:DNA-binding transcriptional ArsR family regulator